MAQSFERANQRHEHLASQTEAALSAVTANVTACFEHARALSGEERTHSEIMLEQVRRSQAEY